MARTKVTIELSRDDEFDLMEKYGRRCSRESLVMRAIADAVKRPAKPKTEPTETKEKKPRKKKVSREVACLITAFENHSTIADKEGRVVTRIEPSEVSKEMVLVQFDGEDSEAFDVAPAELTVDGAPAKGSESSDA